MADPDPVTSGDLVAAVSTALGGDRTGLHDLVGDARQRAKDRAADALMDSVRNKHAVRTGPPPVERPVPRPGPAREIEIRLQDGRRMRARIAPAVARREDLSAVARASAENTRRSFAALRRQRLAIEHLRRSHDELATKLAALQDQSDRLLGGVVQGLAGLQQQVRSARAGTPPAGSRPASASTPVRGRPGPARPPARTPAARQLRRQQLRQIQETRTLAVRAQIQGVTSVVNSVQSAAYGQRGSLFASNNLLLAGTQLFWGLLGPVLETTGVLNAASATLLSALAPLGTLVTGEIALGNQQHVRFLSGVSILDNAGFARVSLRDQVAEGIWPEFRQRTDVLVTAHVVEPAPLVSRVVAARVNQGSVEMQMQMGSTRSLILLMSSLSLSGPVRVAWTVDMGADVG